MESLIPGHRYYLNNVVSEKANNTVHKATFVTALATVLANIPLSVEQMQEFYGLSSPEAGAWKVYLKQKEDRHFIRREDNGKVLGLGHKHWRFLQAADASSEISPEAAAEVDSAANEVEQHATEEKNAGAETTVKVSQKVVKADPPPLATTGWTDFEKSVNETLAVGQRWTFIAQSPTTGTGRISRLRIESLQNTYVVSSHHVIINGSPCWLTGGRIPRREFVSSLIANRGEVETEHAV